ncbi:MAG: type VI secretion system baseplate subunit TssE [Deltaproteobacteria bacterium]|jgi:type VI secretion system protein|nr:type VI secretion system baseplate subunit TssE [Deltaproteobacteria bacterium]
MPTRLRLLERVKLLAAGPTKMEAPKREAVIKSLIDHLTALLSARPSASISAPDFGPPDLLAYGGEVGPAGLLDLEKALSDLIKRYEPRLQNPVVACQPRPDDYSRLVFNLTGSLDDDPNGVALTAYLGLDGQIRVIR